MSYSGNWDILKDQVWFYSCELLDWDFHSVVFKQCQKEQLKPLALPHLILNCQVILVLESSSNKYFSFLYEKYHSLFMVDYHGLVTSGISSQDVFSSQQHCSHWELTASSWSVSYPGLLISGNGSKLSVACHQVGLCSTHSAFPSLRAVLWASGWKCLHMGDKNLGQ